MPALTIRAGAAQADGVIYLAFGNHYSSADSLARSVTEESSALAALGEGLIGSDRPFVTVSGTPGCRAACPPKPTRCHRRAGWRPRPRRQRGPRAGLERGTSRRRAHTAHRPQSGQGRLRWPVTDTARRTGVSGSPGDGSQRWRAVHALDAAVLFRLALEQAPAGTSWHAVADEGDEVRDIAAVIGDAWGCPLRRCPMTPTAPSTRSSRPTSPPPAPTPAERSAGPRHTQACCRTWRTSSPDRQRRLPPQRGARFGSPGLSTHRSLGSGAVGGRATSGACPARMGRAPEHELLSMGPRTGVARGAEWGVPPQLSSLGEHR